MCSHSTYVQCIYYASPLLVCIQYYCSSRTCTFPGGKILCILETHPIHCHTGSPLNPHPAAPMPNKAPVVAPSHTLTAPAHHGAREREGLWQETSDVRPQNRDFANKDELSASLELSKPKEATSSTGKLQRRLNLSKARGEMGCSFQKTEPSSVDCKEEGTSNQPCSRGEGTDQETVASPSAVVLGVVKQSDVPLSWLSAARVYSCLGLFVPKKTRSKLVKLDAADVQSQDEHSSVVLERKGAFSNTDGAVPACSNPHTRTNPQADPSHPDSTSVPDDTEPIGPVESTASQPQNSPEHSKTASSDTSHPLEAPPLTPTQSSLHEHVRHFSPQIRLYRHPVTPPSQHSSLVSSPNCTPTSSRRRRGSNMSPLSGSALRRSPRLNPKVLLQAEMETDGVRVPPCGIWTLDVNGESMARGTEGLGQTFPTPSTIAPKTSPFAPSALISQVERNFPRLAGPAPSHAGTVGALGADRAEDVEELTTHKSSQTSLHYKERSPPASPRLQDVWLQVVMGKKDRDDSDATASLLDFTAVAQDTPQERPLVVESVGLSQLPGAAGGGSGAVQDGRQLRNPEESLAGSGRCFSRQFQGLCLWLARNGFLLVRWSLRLWVSHGFGWHLYPSGLNNQWPLLEDFHRIGQ